MNDRKTQKISFVVPCYYSEATLAGVVAEIDASMQENPGYDYEIVMVNDGSTDGTWEVISTLCGDTYNRKGVNFARKFGQHAALMAGIRQTTGDIIVCLDDDGQTPASEVTKLLEAIENGADVAYAAYGVEHHSSSFRRFGSWMNEKMLQIMLEKPKDLEVSSYFAMRRFVADEVIRYENSYPYLLGLVLRTTKRIVNVPVNHRKRTAGTSGYTFKKLLELWLNGFTAFSIKPLRIATSMGVIFAALGFLYGIYTMIKKLVNPNVPMGFSAMMTAIIFFGGMIMLMVGMAGEYIGRTYISVNSAPQYVVRETCGDEQTAE